ncbi:hypothetical protein [Chryseobacterium sp.]|uniref:hypothetical protein n=1 Tax=Chryseobacterium sp. TaxID=1871047 RepID=UPI0028A0CD1B|nr:hypothetical protein [Chryseobacterium sp.]
MVKKSLHNEKDFIKIKERILKLNPDSERKWGRMTVSQMLTHCNLVLNVPTQKIRLPKIFFLFKWIGIATKYEMSIFNNGILRNMPTFKKLIVTFECDLEKAQSEILQSLDLYRNCFLSHQLPEKHVLFGKMSEKDWGFLEFKHLDHHLKQFNV